MKLIYNALTDSEIKIGPEIDLHAFLDFCFGDTNRLSAEHKCNDGETVRRDILVGTCETNTHTVGHVTWLE